MFFEPSHVRFPIRGSYSHKTRQLALEDSAVQLAYLPEYSDRSQAADLQIVRIVDAVSMVPVEAGYFVLRSIDRARGDIIVARLAFDGRRFNQEIERVRTCAAGRALHHAILHHGRIELTIEDRAHPERSLTNLFVDLSYGQRERRC